MNDKRIVWTGPQAPTQEQRAALAEWGTIDNPDPANVLNTEGILNLMSTAAAADLAGAVVDFDSRYGSHVKALAQMGKLVLYPVQLDGKWFGYWQRYEPTTETWLPWMPQAEIQDCWQAYVETQAASRRATAEAERCTQEADEAEERLSRRALALIDPSTRVDWSTYQKGGRQITVRIHPQYADEEFFPGQAHIQEQGQAVTVTIDPQPGVWTLIGEIGYTIGILEGIDLLWSTGSTPGNFGVYQLHEGSRWTGVRHEIWGIKDGQFVRCA